MNYSNIARTDDAPDDGLTPSQIDAVNDAMDDSETVYEWLGMLSKVEFAAIGRLIKESGQNPLYESLWDYCQQELGL